MELLHTDPITYNTDSNREISLTYLAVPGMGSVIPRVSRVVVTVAIVVVVVECVSLR